MSLVGTPFLVLLGLLTVAAPVAATLLWTRVRGPRPARVAQRLGMIVVAQVAGVALLAAWANDSYDFFSSWSDLFGTSTPVAVVHAVAAGGRGIGGATRPVMAPPPVEHGAAQTGEVLPFRERGAVSGLVTDGWIYLPPQYFQPAYAHVRFPALEVLTGYPGISRALVTKLRYPAVLESEMAARRARPMVLVMLRSTVAPPRDTECADVPHGPQAETLLSRDVPRLVEAGYRVTASRAGWGVMGDSTGGFCAVKMAMRHPDRFAGAVALSGYFTAIEDVTTGDLYGGSRALRDANDPMWRLQHLAPPPISVLLTASRTEAVAYGPTVNFLRLVRPPMHAASIILPSGGHNFRTWSLELPATLDWVSHLLRSPAALVGASAHA